MNENGYCRHGMYTGGIGIDHICGYCEDGANYPTTYAMVAWMKGERVLELVPDYDQRLIEAYRKLSDLPEMKEQGFHMGVGLVQGWSTEPSDPDDLVHDALRMAMQEGDRYCVVAVGDKYSRSHVIMHASHAAGYGDEDIYAVAWPDGGVDFINRNRMMVRLSAGIK